MNIELITKYRLAVDSPDHLMPHGTRQHSSISPLFYLKLERIYGLKPIKVLDLGCAGGEFVSEMIDRGNIAVGLEGSDWSKNMQRCGWGTHPKFLFTCDITKPYEIWNDGEPMQFDLITCAATLEHLTDIPQTLANVKKHLAPNGLFIATIGREECEINGVKLHLTVNDDDWWRREYEKAGFKELEDYEKFFNNHAFHDSAGKTLFLLIASHKDSVIPAAPERNLKEKIKDKWFESETQRKIRNMLK